MILRTMLLVSPSCEVASHDAWIFLSFRERTKLMLNIFPVEILAVANDNSLFALATGKR